MPKKRVNYYGPNDLSCYYNLEHAESVLSNFREDENYDINDLIEFYQIKLYIDNEIYLPKWTKDNIQKIKGKTIGIWKLIVAFWNNISSDNISEVLKQLECWTFQDSFWDITAKLSRHKGISKESFSNLLQLEKVHISEILHHENLIKYFTHEVREYLLNYDKSAELLLSQYVEKHDRERRDYHFPKCLTLKDREKIILRYLDNDDANLNYVRLVLNVKKLADLDISDKTRLKAKRLEKKLNNDILEKNGGVLFGIKLVFNEDQINPIETTKEEETTIYSYSTNYLKSLVHPYQYLTQFNTLFYYLNIQKCINIVSKNGDFGVMEKIFMSSKNEYPIGNVFNYNEKLSMMQIFAYDKVVLNHQKLNIENLIKHFIETHLALEYQLKNFCFNMPSTGTSYFEKIRTLLAEYDSLLRQYKLFKEDGEIDYELLCMSSKAYNLGQIPSFITKKYCYVKKNKLTLPINLLFSDQSGLSYVEPFKENNYSCLYDLIVKEEVLYGNFKSYQWDWLHHLFKLGYLLVDHNGYLRIKDENQLFILKQLYKEEVLSYWHYPEECKIIIDQMINDNILYFEDTLFNKSEQSYFNYYLNKKEFTNGLDLRNSFMHGTNTMSEKKQEHLYYVLLKIIVLTVLKIDDDQRLKFKLEYSQSKTEEMSTK